MTRAEKDKISDKEGLKELGRFCRKFGIPFNLEERTVLGHKFVIKNTRAYTLDGKDIMDAYYQYKIRSKEEENRTGDYGVKAYF